VGQRTRTISELVATCAPERTDTSSR
jgi:hypothetical protein